MTSKSEVICLSGQNQGMLPYPRQRCYAHSAKNQASDGFDLPANIGERDGKCFRTS